MDKALAKTPYSDEWWFSRLHAAMYASAERQDEQVHERVEWMDRLWNIFTGKPPLPESSTAWQATVTREVLKMGRTNMARLAVESKLDRLKLRTFRTTTLSDDEADDGTAPEPAGRPQTPEEAARKLMRRYRTVFADALLHASVMAEGYIWISGGQGDGAMPIVTAEDPRQCVTINDPITGQPIAAMKVYTNTLESKEYAHLVLPADPERQSSEEQPAPTRVVVASRAVSASKSTRLDLAKWEWVADKAGELPVQDRGVMVHRIPSPDGIGDFEAHLDLLARITNMIVDRLWITKLQVFRQRALQDKSKPDEFEAEVDGEGDDENDDDDKIDWDEIFSADPSALWRLPQGMEIWESTPTDIQPILLSVRDDIKEFSAVTRSPLYALVPDATDGSAEGAALAREGQVFKVEKWHDYTEWPLLAACADMLALYGFPEAAAGDLELVWAPADRVSMAQRTSGAAQARAAGVPEQGVWEEYLQVGPETVERWKEMRTREAFLGIVPPQTVQVPVGGSGTTPAQTQESALMANRPAQPQGA